MKQDYLRQAVNLSRKSFEAGAFPAGSVLVTKSGNVYKSDPTTAYYHDGCMVIDKAIKAEGYPLTDAVMYSSMESCLMCSAKMYWAGITKVHYVIPKEKTNTLYAYEDDRPMSEHLAKFLEAAYLPCKLMRTTGISSGQGCVLENLVMPVGSPS